MMAACWSDNACWYDTFGVTSWRAARVRFPKPLQHPNRCKPQAIASPKPLQSPDVCKPGTVGYARHGNAVARGSMPRVAASAMAEPGQVKVSKGQCAISTGTSACSSMLRVAPPSTASRKREWP